MVVLAAQTCKGLATTTLFCRVSTIKKGEKRTKEKLIHLSYPFQ